MAHTTMVLWHIRVPYVRSHVPKYHGTLAGVSVVQRRYERGTKPAKNDVRKSRVSNWCHLVLEYPVPRGSSELSIVIRTICPEKLFSPCSLHNRYDDGETSAREALV